MRGKIAIVRHLSRREYLVHTSALLCLHIVLRARNFDNTFVFLKRQDTITCRKQSLFVIRSR